MAWPPAGRGEETMATYTESTIGSFIAPGEKRVVWNYQQGSAVPDLTGKRISLVGRIFSVTAQQQNQSTGSVVLLLSVAVDPTHPGLEEDLASLASGTLVNINGQWCFTASGPAVQAAVPSTSVGMVAAGVIAAIGNLSFIYIQVTEVQDVKQVGADALHSLVAAPMQGLVVVGFLALVAFIFYKLL